MFEWDKLMLLFEKTELANKEYLSCVCDNIVSESRTKEWYYSLPLKYDHHFDEMINLNLSAVKVATNIYERGCC